MVSTILNLNEEDLNWFGEENNKIKLYSPFTGEELDNDSYCSLEVYAGGKDFVVAACDSCCFSTDLSLDNKLYKLVEKEGISYVEAIEEYYENKKTDYLLIKLETSCNVYGYLFKNNKKLNLTNKELLNNFNPKVIK